MRDPMISSFNSYPNRSFTFNSSLDRNQRAYILIADRNYSNVIKNPGEREFLRLRSELSDYIMQQWSR